MNLEKKYIKSFIKAFDLVYHDALRDMFNDLIKNGWTTNIEIYGKEKYGLFFCEISTNKKLQDIADKHIRIINSICPDCGKGCESLFEDDTSKKWISYTCFNCWKLRIEKYFTISNISNSGFNYSITNNNLTERKDINWFKDVKSVKLNNKSSLYLYKEIDFELEIELLNNKSIFFDNSYINFYQLLKNIPSLYFIEHDDLKCVDYLLSNLSDCPICQKISLIKNQCLVCNTKLEPLLKWPNESYDSWKYYNKIDEIIFNKRDEFCKHIQKNLILKYRFHKDKSFEESIKFT